MSGEQDPQEKHPDIARLDKHADQLRAHYTTVQIFASRFNESTGDTHYFTVGHGHYLGRYGQCKSWVLREEAGMAQGTSYEGSDD